MSPKLKVAVFLPQHYDYLAKTIVEGLHHLGYQIFSNEASNGLKSRTENFKDYLNQSDIVIIFSGLLVSIEEAYSCNIENKIVVFVDTADSTDISPMPDLPVNIIFKRELLPQTKLLHGEIIRPIGFGIEDRYRRMERAQKSYNLSFVGSMSNFMRRTVSTLLMAYNDGSVFCGGSGELAYNGISGEPIDTPNYFRILSCSEASIDVPGSGWDCGRTWEIIGSRASLIKMRSPLLTCAPLLPEEHFWEFGDLEDLVNVVERIRTNPRIAKDTEARCFNFSLENHTTKARAKYFMDAIEEGPMVKFLPSNRGFRTRPKNNVKIRRVFYYSARILYNRIKTLTPRAN